MADYLDTHARTRPDHTALHIENETLTYSQLAHQVHSVASGFTAHGIGPNETVALVLPNCIEFVVAWLALGRIGAITAPVNTSLGTDGLAHALHLSGATNAIVDVRFAATVKAALPRATNIDTILLRGDTPEPDLNTVTVKKWSDLYTPPTHARQNHVHPGDASILLFTSGSTGRSKACVLPHRYVTRQAEIFIEQLKLSPTDVLFCPFPLFHADAAIFTVAPALILGATAALVERFSVRRFWDQIRHYHATVFDFMGATLTMLHKQHPAPDDLDNPARLGWGVPLPDWAQSFERRFGLELVEVYGLSDAGIVLYNRPGEPRHPGSCGHPIGSFDVRILDEDGFEAPTGQTGEICIRPREPHIIMTEYLGMPDATAQAFRGCWFHTGDRAYQDEDRYFYFVGRNQDVIRRRGENISALDIEDTISKHPAVLEVAAFGVPSELTDDEVMVTVVVRRGHSLTAPELLEYCDHHLPTHMAPRYIEFDDNLPKTPTEKVEKHVLRTRGPSDTTFDRDTRKPRTSR
ncbi:AMP-binding protein [Nocardia jejuensis]|uniref:AMP-binding protein n=1 Tax=Nocardia jejuensis TaxID=328049 RepID=UPI00147215B4|nr:AMP-binding protein [Nocardia jejuensis]